MRQLVLFHFGFTRPYRHDSRSRGLRFGGIRSGLLENHNTLTQISFLPSCRLSADTLHQRVQTQCGCQ